MEKKKLTLKLGEQALDFAKQGRKSFRELLLAFVTTPRRGETRNLTELTYCRESFCEYVRQQLRGVHHHNIATNKLHMVINRKVARGEGLNALRNQAMAAQRMVNVIEKHYGWPLTRMYPVKLTQKVPETCQFYYITASKRWIKAPAMLSLFTLLLRIAASESKFKFKHRIKSMKSLFIVLDELAERSSYPEIRYYAEHGHNWQLVLDNYRNLFGSREMKDLYFPNKNGYFFAEGINQICDLSSADGRLNRSFKKLVLKRKGKKS